MTSDQPVYWRDYWIGEKFTEEPVQKVMVALDAGLTSRAIIAS